MFSHCICMITTKRRIFFGWYNIFIAFLIVCNVKSMIIRRPWTSKQWCQNVLAPPWPFAYEKQKDQKIEWKGRTNSNKQDMRHKCTYYGVQSKCHICEDFTCGIQKDQQCAYQLQGVAWSNLAKNIPTVTDAPWSVGGKHRYDYTGGTHICLFLSGGDCLTPFGTNYASCSIRCWGLNSGKIASLYHPEKGKASLLSNGDADASDIWSYPKNFTSDGKPQGMVRSVAGTGEKGFKDGPVASAQFNNPQDVAVDSNGILYIADTNNHRIRKIDPTSKTVSTIAGDGMEGFQDGPALQARFSFPMGIAVYEDPANKVSVYVADTGNHRIRKIMDGKVTCIAGLCGTGVETKILTKSQAQPHPGLADGDLSSSRYDSPMGIAVDQDGIIFVADTGNHLIRRIDMDGKTNTLAGNVVPMDPPIPGCVSPCMKGVAGFRDGNLTYAQFKSPRDIAIGPQKTVVVVDGHRVRRINYDGTTSVLEGVTSSNRVVTLAGSESVPGNVDGSGQESTFHFPSGVSVSADGRVYVTSPITCKIRQVSTSTLVSRPATCFTRLVDIVSPQGCSSYEQEVDEVFTKVSPSLNNIYYNFKQRNEQDPIDGLTLPGRQMKECIGVPPVDTCILGDRSRAYRNELTNATINHFKEDVDDGTTIKVNCPSNCLPRKEQAPIYGTGMYTDTSSICLAAIHAGIIDDTIGGLVTVTLERGINFFQDAIRKGTLKNGLTSLDMSTQQTSARLFSLNKYPLAQVEVQTIAGSPSALLKSGCGFRDGMPPLSAQFNAPSGLEIYSKDSLTRTKYLYIADSGNHRIRSMTATCSKICENGGVCSAPDTCSCPNGWSGDDCTVPVCSSVTCANRQVCVGPNQCACIPGFTGFPACTTAQCVQICANGGKCTAPDTCSCTSGWFDTNCTTPVCTQTCGNGGNCTAPNTCSCATEWKGTDCRLPVCEQECKNGGSCVAPNTCQCPAGWSGHDCSTPVCSQGFFVPHPNAYKQGRPRPFVWPSYVPCPFGDWCEITKEFDCLARLSSPTGNIPFGPSGRWQTGRKEPILNPKQCFPIEVGRTALTHFPYLDEQNKTHGFFRYAPKRPFLHNATRQSPWRVPVNILDTTTIYGIEVLPPFNLDPDRQVALVEKRNIVQGVYACANGGSCVAPDICECKSGWIGFDCRTPVCSQGYYVPDQTKFVASDPPESKHPRHPISNPPYTITVETMSYENVQVDTKVKQGDIRYKFLDGSFQGGYACSIRSLTQWEKPTTIGPNGSNESLFEHPNYFSGYMDKTLSKDGFYHTHWKEMYWPPLYELTQPLLDDTREGWKRAGIWIRISSHKWQKGKCLVEFQRTCTSSQSTSLPVLDLETNQFSILVTDPDVAYRSRVNYSHIQATRKGFWNGTEGKECIDQVIRGCFNNGTCIGPNTCKCAEGWKGSDCSIPICEQNCLHHGNCTLPNRCTCEKGWTGKDCSIPLCAQECRNNGTCISPDTCECQQWESDWRDGRENGGQAVFKTPQGTPQLTGWTGYDCSTPICVQAEKFVFNVNSSKYARNFVQLRQEAKDFHVLRGRQFGKEEDKKLCEKAHRCPQFDEELVSNDGQSFQFGCENVKPILQSATVKKTSSDKNKLENLRNYMDHLNVDRTSKDFLCGNFEWEQGDYIDQGGRQIRINYRNYTKLQDDTWKMEAWSLPGEGIYECFHQSACIAPDTCSCSDGYEGIDCRKPQCRFLQANGSVHFGCKNDGVCVDKDVCQCIQIPSTLFTKYGTSAPKGTTGFFGSDCGIPICLQGIFDPLCNTNDSGNLDGCYRCANRGKCIAPDVCECAPGWTGFDCKTPICEIPEKNMTSFVKYHLFTVDDQKVRNFQKDPCGTQGGRWGKQWFNGAQIGQGNCTLPSKCTCLCRQRYDPKVCEETGELCEKPWQDPFNRILPPGYIYGTKDCVDGFQGIEDENGNFMSCHLQIYVPSLWRRYTVSAVTILTVLGAIGLLGWYYIRKQIKRRLLLAKAERRRSRKNSEENSFNSAKTTPKSNAFQHRKMD